MLAVWSQSLLCTEPSENEGYEAHFKQMDTNADEVLEKNEFMAHAAIDRFNVVDDDKDGFISFDEYMAHDDSFYHHDDPEEVAATPDLYNLTRATLCTVLLPRMFLRQSAMLAFSWTTVICRITI